MCICVCVFVVNLNEEERGGKVDTVNPKNPNGFVS